MKNTRHIIIFLMITALLVSGLPHFAAEDMDRDSRIGLKACALPIWEFVRSAAEPGKFIEKTRNTLSTMQANEGLKTVIQKAGDKNFTPPNPHFLLSFFIFFFSFHVFVLKISVCVPYFIAGVPCVLTMVLRPAAWSGNAERPPRHFHAHFGRLNDRSVGASD